MNDLSTPSRLRRIGAGALLASVALAAGGAAADSAVAAPAAHGKAAASGKGPAHKPAKPVPFNVSGTIADVNVALGTVSVKVPHGKRATTATYRVTSATKISRNGRTVALVGLAAGDAVVAHGRTVSGVSTVTSILGKGKAHKAAPFTSNGRLAAVDATVGTITVSVTSGSKNVARATTTYPIPGNAKISRNDQIAALADVVVGDSVTVHGTVNDAGVPAVAVVSATGAVQPTAQPTATPTPTAG